MRNNKGEIKVDDERSAVVVRSMPFQEEFVGFLLRHEIAFDERYPWK